MSKPLGTAAWAQPLEVIERHAFASGALWLGRSPTDDDSALGFSDDRHVCLTSGSRGGKGTTIIVNNLALWPGSIVVIDPKGENASITAARRGPGSEYCKGLGQAVHVLDPFNAAKVNESLRGRFNPLDALDPAQEEAIDEAGRIADALVVTNPEAKDPFWDESARAFVKALILHVLTSEEFEGKRNLVTIRDLITRGDAEKIQILKDMGETEVPSAHALLWEGASSNTAFHGVIARVGSSFANMLAASPKQYESVRQVADRNTEFIDSPGMQRCLETSSFKLSDLKLDPKGVSVFLSLPQRYMSTHFRWLRMMIALTITEMEATKGPPATGHRVLFCLDEFAGLKRMEVIENAVAQIAGYGVKLMFVLQTLEQLKGTYKDKWETFLSNCGVKIFFGLEDHFTREYVSKFIGEMEVVRTARTTSEATGTQVGVSHTKTESIGVSVNEQVSSSVSNTHTKSTGTSRSTARGRNSGASGGSNWGLNLGHNSSDGSSWKPQLFFGREDERRSDNAGWSQGANYGRNNGWSEGSSLTQTDGTSTGESRSHGTGQSHTRGFTVSENRGTSDTESRSQSQTSTQGLNESVHKRRLITEDELGLVFQRLSKKDHPAYPGLALVLAAGEQPIFLRKVNYFEDPQFIDCYDPHPDHPFRPLIEHKAELLGPREALLEALNRHASTRFSISEILADAGDKVRAGEPLLRIEGTAYGKRTAAIHAPLSGRVAELPISRGKALSSQTLATITYYGDAQTPQEAFKEIDALVAAINAAHESAQRPAPTPAPPVTPPSTKSSSSLLLGLGSIVALVLLIVVLAQNKSGAPQDASTSSLQTPTNRDDEGISDWDKRSRAMGDTECVATDDGFHARFPRYGGPGEYRFNPQSHILLQRSNAQNCFVRASYWRFSPSTGKLQVSNDGRWNDLNIFR